MTPEAAAAILNVKVSATRTEIDAAYRLRARMSHPDRFAGAPAADIKAASAEFVRISDARDVLRARIPTHASPRTESPQPRPTREPTLSFEEFVRASDTYRWHDGQTSGRRSDGAPFESSEDTTRLSSTAPKRALFFRGWWPVALTIAALIALASGMATSAANKTAFGNSESGSSIIDHVHQEVVVDQPSVQKHCEAGFKCWMWTLTSDSSCPSASVTIRLTSTLGGPTTETARKYIALTANQPVRLLHESTASANVYASIDAITC
ncbi:J domain-containing protein [Cryobacterium sp. 10S3]|uniref:J domain-containing protein n=1 Tax=unclassified Cryobacterium TaxID=2649013 RepID=UPI002AC8A9E2|nr:MULTISPECIES: J domain-containing protein [unclassified Cryobacterium]MEB0001679.1 J domain-containing protein [Cryobacterium sp. RTC2.1]MEB0286711.1 J domain-containing protein [Cryobacterium sp. 10S3]WPX13168.1 J domain-containing protein [Cryobacterium sp. 10S3]